jgi:hypothetical protein
VEIYSRRNGHTLPAFILALGLVVAAWIGARAAREVKLANQTIAVKGYAERRITSDQAVWTGRFGARAKALPAAYDKMRADLARAQDFLGKNGVTPEQIKVSAISVSSEQGVNEKGETTFDIAGYVLDQSITVTSNDIALIEKISNTTSDLIQAGVAFNSDAPQYFYTQLNNLKIEMLGEAVKDAKLRAEQFAKNSGHDVGKLRSAQQGVFQITPEYSTEISNSGEFDTTSVSKIIKAVVTMEFSID